MIYLFTDGYHDQFGGMKLKKFGKRKFRDLLVSIYEMDMKKQKKALWQR